MIEGSNFAGRLGAWRRSRRVLRWTSVGATALLLAALVTASLGGAAHRGGVLSGTSAIDATAYPSPPPVYFAAGTHIGYAFNSGGGITASKAYTLTRSSWANATKRATIAGRTGTWLYIANGIWAGYWVRESSDVYALTGMTSNVPLVPARYVSFAAGTHTGYLFGSWGRVVGEKTAWLARPSRATAIARATVNSRKYLLIRDGIWAAYWVPESSSVALYPEATGTVTTATVADAQPALPVRAAFYYPWFPETWGSGSVFPNTEYRPTSGYYNSSDPAVIRQHIAAMKYGGIQVGISSWWGQGHYTDTRLASLLSATAGSDFRWTIYHETEGYSDPTVSQIRSDLTYIRDHYASDPSYFRIGGRFVVFVYASPYDGCTEAERWRQANSTVGAYLVLKVFSGYGTCAAQPSSWHQYAPAVAADAQAGYSFAISPGFDMPNEPTRLARDLSRWRSNIRSMVASRAPFQLVTTFNEWGEGTAVESGTAWATSSGYGAYLDALHTNGVAPAATTSSPTPSPTMAVSVTPTPAVATALPDPTATAAPPPSATPVPTASSTPTPTVDPTVVGAGDISSCSSTGDSATAALLDGIPGTVFTVGDNAYEAGTATEFANCFAPTWGRHFARIRPAVGNHEYATAGAAGYFGYFGATAGQPGQGWYAYDTGSWRVYVLNSNCGQVGGCYAGSAQEQWLRADLAANPRSCVLAYWHHPRFSSGEHGNHTSVQPLWQALWDANADLILGGHDHDYERFAPQNPAGVTDALRGIREFVVGTGGKSHYAFTTIRPNSEVRNGSTFGVLKLTLHAGSYDWQFVPVAGGTFSDAGRSTCH